MVKILYINPIAEAASNELIKEVIEEIKRPDVEAVVKHIGRGPDHLEYHYYEHIVSDEVLRMVREAEKEGFDAVIIGCFYDPCLREAREIVSIPVIGPAEASMHVAATLGHKFSIIVGRRKWVPKMESNVYLYGLDRKLASFREVNFTVREMVRERERLKNAIYEEAKRAVEEDGAEVIILGCTMESGFAKELSERLKVPVIDPVVVSWKFAEMMADLYRKMGISHSKLYGYEPPPPEEGWLT